MTEEQILSFVDLVEWAEMLDAHPVDAAQEIEREIDAEMEAYRAMRKQQAEETLKNPDGSWKPFRSWASYPRKRLAPLPADEANFYGAYE